MESGPAESQGQAETGDASIQAEIQGKDTTLQTSTPLHEECPHHTDLLRNLLRKTFPPGTHPCQMLDLTPLWQMPVGLSGNCNVGTSATAGCTCANRPDASKYDMISELDDMIQQMKTDGKRFT